MPESTTIPVGNTYEPVRLDEIRTAAQRATVLAIAASDEFAFACHNPFDAADWNGRQGPIGFVWVDRAGEVHRDRIGQAGQFLCRIKSGA